MKFYLSPSPARYNDHKIVFKSIKDTDKAGGNIVINVFIIDKNNDQKKSEEEVYKTRTRFLTINRPIIMLTFFVIDVLTIIVLIYLMHKNEQK